MDMIPSRYLFVPFIYRTEPDDTSPEEDRDVFNEKPSKEDIISATEASGKFLGSFQFYR